MENLWTATRAWRVRVRSKSMEDHLGISKRDSFGFEWIFIWIWLLARSLGWIRIEKRVQNVRTMRLVLEPRQWISWAPSSHRPVLRSPCGASTDWWIGAKWMEQDMRTRSDHRSLYRTRKGLIDSIHHIGQTKQGDEKAERGDICLGQAGQILAGVGRGCCCPGWGSTFVFFWLEEKRVLTAAEDLSPVFESISSEGSVGIAALRQDWLSTASRADW